MTGSPGAAGSRSPGPLDGIRVLELGSYIAGPFASRLLGEFGADVIKVERPVSGDELRRWRLHAGDTSLLWRTMARNKRSVTLDLQTERGRELVLDLVEQCDVLVENFRPGTLERLGLSPDTLRSRRPDLVVVRISGYGQTGPYAHRAGFGGVAEAMGGLRSLTGHPDRPPIRAGVAIGDSLAGLYAAFGAVTALLARERGDSGGAAETVDVALYEAVFSVLESVLPDYDAFGIVQQRSGARLPGVAPANTYPCADGQFVVIGGNGDAIFPRLVKAIGRDDLGSEPELAENEGRVRHEALIDAAIEEFTRAHRSDEVLAALDVAGVPASSIYEAPDIVADPHYLARDMVLRHMVDTDGDGTTRPVAFPGVVPRLEQAPGSVRWVGPDLGEHTVEVLTELLGLTDQDVRRLRTEQVV